MCLIIHAGRKETIPDYVVTSAIQKNKDGWGVMWFEEGQMKVRRSLKMNSLPKFLKKIEKYERVIHLRMATHGTINQQNCHPFQVREGLYFAHNGVMSEYGTLKDDKSDTVVFNETIIKPMAELYTGEDILGEPWFRHTMEKFAGTSQRFAFMDSLGRVLRVGPWNQHKGIWLSNSYAWSYPYESNYSTRRNIDHFYDYTKSSSSSSSRGQNVSIYDYRKSKEYQNFWKENVERQLEAMGEKKLLSAGSTESLENNQEIEVDVELVQDIVDSLANVDALNDEASGEFNLFDLQAMPTTDIAHAIENSPAYIADLIKNAKLHK